MLNAIETKDGNRALMSFKPKMIHVFTLVLALSVTHSLIFVNHFLGGSHETYSLGGLPGLSQWVFWLNASLLALFAVSLLHLMRLNHHIYEISEKAVTELHGLLNRERRTVPLEKVFSYRLNRSPWDLVLGTAHLTIMGSNGLPVLTIEGADYSDARNAENLVGMLLRSKGAHGRAEMIEGRQDKQADGGYM